MVHREGAGLVAPSPIVVNMTGQEVALLKREAERRHQFRGYGKRTDQWGQGLFSGEAFSFVGSINGDVLGILVGMVGEYAICRHLSSRLGTPIDMDLVPRVTGDGGKDLLLYGMRIQIKTRKRMKSSNLIRCRTEGGRECPLTCDAYAFCAWSLQPGVLILGWAGRGDVSEWTRSPAKVGNHTNLEGEDYQLQPAERLVAELQARREMR